MAKRPKKAPTAKKYSQKRTANPPGRPGKRGAKTGSGAAFNEQDPQRRLGNYEGAGEHPRVDMRGL